MTSPKLLVRCFPVQVSVLLAEGNPCPYPAGNVALVLLWVEYVIVAEVLRFFLTGLRVGCAGSVPVVGVRRLLVEELLGLAEMLVKSSLLAGI